MQTRDWGRAGSLLVQTVNRFLLFYDLFKKDLEARINHHDKYYDSKPCGGAADVLVFVERNREDHNLQVNAFDVPK